ncbi:MAG TPA: O-antigen ligase family protein [Gammaproteobacteria bacterium]|nr:O-antigen ligase family protein [Gammaproteobacteria bacterium]
MSGELRREWWQPAVAADRHVVAAGTPALGQASSVSFWALIAFTIVLVLAPQDHLSFLKPLHLAMLSALAAGGSYVIDRYRGHCLRAPPSPEFLWLGAIVLWAIATLPFSLWPGGSYQTLTGLFLKAVVIFWLLARVVDSPARLKTVAWLLSLAAVPLSLSAVKAFVASGGAQNPDLSLGLSRINGYEGGLTSNPNDLALMINLILPLTLGLVFCTRRWGLRFLLCGGAVLDAIAILATYSRGGFLMLATIVCSYLVVLCRRGRYFAVIAFLALGAATVPMLPSGYMQRLSTIVSIQNDQTNSAQDRWRDMKAAARYAFRHPVIGAGIGMSQLELNQVRGPEWVEVHNVYLKYAMELGWVGLALYLLLFGAALRSTRRACLAAARAGERELFFLAQAIGVSLVGFTVAAMFYPDAYEFYFFYFAGLAVAARMIGLRAEAAIGANSRAREIAIR